MANSQGVLLESIWRDKDFRALPRTAQATYGELISQKELDRAGIQPLMVSKWSKGCDEITDDDVWADLAILQERRFVFYDTETDELFVRAYMRTCDIVRYPNILKNALRCAGLVASEKLRHELAVELRRLRRAEATKVADEIDPGEVFANPSETLSEPIANPSKTVPEGLNGSRTVSEPPGMGKGTGIGLVPEVVTAAASKTELRQQQPNLDDLKANLVSEGLTASWAGVRTAELDEIRALLAQHGQRRLVDAALAGHWANNPAKSVRAWLPRWRELTTASAPPTRPDWCGECDETTRQRTNVDGDPFRCPECHPLAKAVSHA